MNANETSNPKPKTSNPAFYPKPDIQNLYGNVNHPLTSPMSALHLRPFPGF